MSTPRLIAFDLDATLWLPEMYELQGGTPFTRDADGRVFDKSRTEIRLIGDSRSILHRLATDSQFKDVHVAYVSRTEYPQWAMPCLQTFLIDGQKTMLDISSYQEIYPGCKRVHFKAIINASGGTLSFKDILFFDNEIGNIRDCSSLGIVSVYTPIGMTEAKFQEGLDQFASRDDS